MNKKRLGCILSLIFIFSIILTGCEKVEKSAVAKEVNTPSKVEKDNVVYVMDKETNEVKASDKHFVKKGKLIQIPIDVDYTGENNLYVDTSSGQYAATIYEGDLYYIGDFPTEEMYIINVFEEIVEEEKLDKNKFKEVDGEYVYHISDSEDIRGISIHFEGENDFEYIPVEFKDEGYYVKISKDLYNKEGEFKLTLWKAKTLL